MTQPAKRAAVIALLLWALALAVGGGVIWRTQFNADLSAFLPASPNPQQRVLIEQLSSGASARTLILAIEGGQATQRAAASVALAKALRGSGLFEQVNNGERAAWGDIGQWLIEHRYALSPAIDAARFTAAGLREAIDDSLSLLGTPAGAALKPLLGRDPTGETQRIAEAGLSSAGPRSEHGVWVSRDGQRALLMTGSRATGADLDAQAAVLTRIRSDFAAIATASTSAAGLAPAGLTLLISGTPQFAVASRTQIQAEVSRLAIVGTLLMGSLLLIAFGSAQAMAVCALPVASGMVAGVAAVSLGFGSVHGITLGFGTTLIGEAVDYAIYYLIQARRLGLPSDPQSAPRTGRQGPANLGGDTAQAGWRAWLRHSWPTLRLGLLTSLCGFAALAWSGFPGLQQLGVFSMAGLLAAALTTRYVLPVLAPHGAQALGLRRWLGAFAARCWVVLSLWRHAFSALALAAVAVLVWQHQRLWLAELSSLSPIAPEALALDASLRTELYGSDGGALVVVQMLGQVTQAQTAEPRAQAQLSAETASQANAQAVLQAAESAALRLDALVSQGRLGGYDSVTRLLPSLATQQRRRAALPEAEALQAALAEATLNGPLPASRLTRFVAEVAQARTAADLTPESMAATPLAPLVNALLVRYGDGHWTALMPLHAVAGQRLDPAALHAALQGLPQAQWIDVGSELGRLYQHYLAQARTQALLGALAVLALMGLWLRSWRRLLAVSLPLLLALLLTLAGLALLQVPLGILHLVGLLLVVAVGSNYALFFDLLRQPARPPTGPEPGARTERKADHDTLASLLLANLTTVLSFGLIATSSIPALSAIGQVVAPGALLALILSAAYGASPQCSTR